MTIHGPTLPRSSRLEMIAHAVAAGDREACGLVGYDRHGNVARVYCLSNVHADPDKFLLDPAEHFATIQAVEAKGWTIGAVFHSHPFGPPYPSPTDLTAPLDPHWISFVVSPISDGWQVTAFSIRDGGCAELGVGEKTSQSLP